MRSFTPHKEPRYCNKSRNNSHKSHQTAMAMAKDYFVLLLRSYCRIFFKTRHIFDAYVTYSCINCLIFMDKCSVYSQPGAAGLGITFSIPACSILGYVYTPLSKHSTSMSRSVRLGHSLPMLTLGNIEIARHKRCPIIASFTSIKICYT